MKAQEIWKDIPDYEGIYQASNLGRIRTCEKMVKGKYKPYLRPLKIMRLSILTHKNTGRKDYKIVLSKNGKKKSHIVARLIASAFYGKSDLTINHINGNTLDNRIENLEWCSLSENIQKGYDMGLCSRNKPIWVLDKKTHIEYKFNSCSGACRHFKVYGTYWCKRKTGKTETKRFKWRFL